MPPPSPTGFPRLPARYWRLAVAAGMASYLDAAALMSVGISLAIWRDHYGLGAWQVGLLTAGFGFSTALGAVTGGWLGDRFGRRRVFSLDLLVFAAGTVILLLAPNGTMLTLGAVVVGLACGADIPTSLAVIADEAPGWARGRLTGLTQLLWIAGILGTFLLGYGVSTLGFPGTQILVGHLTVLALVTWAARTRDRPNRTGGEQPRAAGIDLAALRTLVGGGALVPLATIMAFYVFWNIAAGTVGTYGSYLMITVTGLNQTHATGLVLLTFPLALLMAIAYVRLADSVWRDRLFGVATILQVTAFLIGALTGGVVIAGMIVLLVLYSLSNVFAGEAAYKVWSQLLFPAAVRSTALGLTYGVGRATAAAVLLVIPALVAHDPAIVLWGLTGCVAISGLVGQIITRRLIPALQPERSDAEPR